MGRGFFIKGIMTKKTKEAIKTTVVIIIVGIAVVFLWVYPLNQAGKIAARFDPPDEPLDPAEYGLAFDTLSILTEDNLNMRGAMIYASVDDSAVGSEEASARGTVILLHGLAGLEPAVMDRAAAMAGDGYHVVLYDQRGYGRSDGEYCSGGYYEANDLEAVIYRLDLEDRLLHPVIVWGLEQGGAAAMRAWAEEERIDYVVAENAIVNCRDWQKRMVRLRDLSAPDILLSVIWWWYKQKTGHEIQVEESDIGDQCGEALTNKPERYLCIACGEGEVPENSYLAQLADMGGNWLVLPCEEDIFREHSEEIMSAVRGLIGD